MSIQKCPTFTTIIPTVLLVALVLLVRIASAQENAGATRSQGEQTNRTIAAAAMRYELLNSSDGKYIEFELAVMREHRHRGRTAQDIEETVTTLRRNRSVSQKTDEPRSLIGVEIGVAAGLPWLHGGVSATWQTEIPATNGANGGHLMKPSVIQQPRQLLTRYGEPLRTLDDLTDPAVLQENYDALENGTDQLPDDKRQDLQRFTINEHIRLYEHDPEYAAASNSLFDGRLPRPTADPETVMDAYPEFADRFRTKELLDLARQSEKGDTEARKSLEEKALAGIATLADAIPASKADDRASKADRENLLDASADQAIDLVGQFNPVLANQLRATKDLSTGVPSAIDTFKATTAAGGDKFFATANFTLSVTNMVFRFFSSLSGVETPHQQVMAEIQKVHKAIQEMRAEMDSRFDEVLATITDSFKRLSSGQDAIRADIALVADELKTQRELLYGIVRKVRNVQWMIILYAHSIMDWIAADSLVERRCIRVDRHNEEIDEKTYLDCVNILGYLIGHPADDTPFGGGLQRKQLSEEYRSLADLAGESGLTLTTRRLAKALAVAGKPVSLPDKVVGYRTLLYARNLVHRFLLENPERTSIERESTSWEDGFSNVQMFRGIEAYEHDLAKLIEVIQQEVTAFQAGEPSAIDAMLDSMRTTVRNLRDDYFHSTVDSFYAGRIPIDDAADWAEGKPVPEWIEVVQDGNCYDNLISPATKLDAARLLMQLVHQRDLRPALGGYGRIEVCVRTQNKRKSKDLGRRDGEPVRWIELQLAIDYRPEVACVKDATRLSLLEEIGQVATGVFRQWIRQLQKPARRCPWGPCYIENDTVYRTISIVEDTGAGRDRDGLTIRGTKEIIDRRSGQGQRQRLPPECWYQNVVTQEVEALETERLKEWNLLRREILAGEKIGHADEDLEQELTHLRNLLFSAYQFFPLYDDAARKKLDAISLKDLVETGPPWDALDRAEIDINRIGVWLRSDRMRSFTRTNRFHIRPDDAMGPY